MSWNHRDRVFALGVALQPTKGQFVQPGLSGLIGVSTPNNGSEAITAADPTQTGTIWDAPPIFLGETGTGGGTIPLRGPGGSVPPAANSWPLGLIMQACGFTEIRRGTPQLATALGAGSTPTSLVLANSEAAIDDFYVGMPIQQDQIGQGFRRTSLIQDYVGATRTAILAETLGGIPTADYTMPAGLFYVLSTLTIAPPLLSISIWRDQVRYDYMDCVITNWSLDIPVSNENNTVFPSLDFTVKGTPLDPVDDVTPALPQQVLNVQPPAAKGGKFFLDRIKLGHTGVKTTIALTSGAASNQNQDEGQDGQDIQSGSRTVDLTLNQMNVSDFNVKARVKARAQIPLLSTWGQGNGNKLGLMIPAMLLNPLNPQTANGYVTLAGNAQPSQLDKGIAFSVWYD